MIRIDPSLGDLPDPNDPRFDEPSPVPGLSRLAFEDYAREIRWFSRLTAGQVVRMGRADFEREATLRRYGAGA